MSDRKITIKTKPKPIDLKLVALVIAEQIMQKEGETDERTR